MRGASLSGLVKQHGMAMVKAAIALEIERAEKLCGGNADTAMLVAMAEQVVLSWPGRTLNAFRLAIHDGLNSGKLYGKLNYPVIAEWMLAHEAKVEEWSYNQHRSHQ